MARSADVGSQGGHVIQASGLDFYYQAHGEGHPLLLLHAGSLTGDMWQPYLAGFARRFRVIAPDLPNHGRSGKPERPLSYRQLADEIVAFIRALELPRPVIVGFSDGGQVALEIGIRYPDLPHSIAMGGVVFKDSEPYRAFVRGALGDAESRNVDPAHLARNHPDWAAWLDHIYGSGSWKPLLEQLKPMWTTPLMYTAEDFAEVVAPALVFVGDRDELVLVEQAAEMYRQLPKAELAVVPDADHGAFFSAKVASFQAIILDFLQRHNT
jgi:pimeloyl-ACP methyl ester carboxylesterase